MREGSGPSRACADGRQVLDYINYAERNNRDLLDPYYLDDHMRHSLESLAGMFETE